MTPYQDHTGRAQKVSSESRLYGRVFRDNPYHHPSLLPSSFRPRCFLLFSSHSSKPTRAIVGALRCCRSRKKKMKISIPTGTHSSARDTRGVSIDASSTRFVRKGGLPVSAQSINVLRLSILFPSVFVLRPACHPTRAASASALSLHCPRPPPLPFALVARPRVPVIPVRSPHFVLITSHRQPGRARLSALPRDNAAQLLIALPISARARSRTTSPAAGLQTNACPIINCHDPLIACYASLRRPRTFPFSRAKRYASFSSFDRSLPPFHENLLSSRI